MRRLWVGRFVRTTIPKSLFRHKFFAARERKEHKKKNSVFAACVFYAAILLAVSSVVLGRWVYIRGFPIY